MRIPRATHLLILASTRWKLKRAIRVLNQTFNELKLVKHPDKTLLGRTERGFDFLGYHFSPKGVSLAKKTIANFIVKALRLYEQEPPHNKMRRFGEYARKWTVWASGGLAMSRTEKLLKLRLTLHPAYMVQYHVYVITISTNKLNDGHDSSTRVMWCVQVAVILRRAECQGSPVKDKSTL